MMNEHINCLPVPTWNHTGVNWAQPEAGLPPVPGTGWGAANTAAGPLPAGVVRLAAAPEECSGLESGGGEALERFVKNYVNAPCHLRVEGEAEAPFVITHQLEEERPAVIEHQTIYAAPGSSLTVVQVCRSGERTQGICASLTQICAGRGAKLRLVQVQLCGEGCRQWSAVGIRAQEGAQVELVRATLGGALSACASRALLEGRESRYELEAVYFGDGARSLDFNDTAVHTGRETASELHSAGVLAGRSRKILRGTIDFRPGAVRAVGHESEDVLLFSPEARNRTAPLILCGEEQVEGQHAATAGRLDEGMLYYLTSRGITPAQARRLMVEARFAPTLDRIPVEELREEILADIGRRLDIHERREG